MMTSCDGEIVQDIKEVGGMVETGENKDMELNIKQMLTIHYALLYFKSYFLKQLKVLQQLIRVHQVSCKKCKHIRKYILTLVLLGYFL